MTLWGELLFHFILKILRYVDSHHLEVFVLNLIFLLYKVTKTHDSYKESKLFGVEEAKYRQTIIYMVITLYGFTHHISLYFKLIY